MTIIKASQSAQQLARFRFAPTGLPDKPQAVVASAPFEAIPQAEPVLELPHDTARTQEIAKLQRALEAKSEELTAACERAFDEGRQLGLAAAADREQERFQALQDKLSEGLGAIADHLAAREDQAVGIARAVLQRILGDRSAYAGMVAETAALWRRSLAEATVLKVVVSAQDFAGESDLAALQLRLGNVAVERDPAMASGDCRFSLALGEVDLSLPLQASAAERLLADHAPESAAA